MSTEREANKPGMQILGNLSFMNNQAWKSDDSHSKHRISDRKGEIHSLSIATEGSESAREILDLNVEVTSRFFNSSKSRSKVRNFWAQ